MISDDAGKQPRPVMTWTNRTGQESLLWDEVKKCYPSQPSQGPLLARNRLADVVSKFGSVPGPAWRCAAQRASQRLVWR